MCAFQRDIQAKAQAALEEDIPRILEDLEAADRDIDTCDLASLAKTMMPRVLRVRECASHLALCLGFGLPGADDRRATLFSTSVVKCVSEFISALESLTSDVDPMCITYPIALSKLSQFVSLGTSFSSRRSVLALKNGCGENRKRHKKMSDMEACAKEIEASSREELRIYCSKLRKVLLMLLSVVEKNDKALRPTLAGSGAPKDGPDSDFNVLFT